MRSNTSNNVVCELPTTANNDECALNECGTLSLMINVTTYHTYVTLGDDHGCR